MNQTTPKKVSPGLAFLLATKEAMPRTIGDRIRSAAMHDALDIAIRCRFKFDKDDGQLVKQLSLRSCVGVFNVISEHAYSKACSFGGTFARMYEQATGLKPWMAKIALTISSRYNNGHEAVMDNRVAPGMGVLLAGEDTDPDMPRMNGLQVWWCTSVTDNAIVLCRYRLIEGHRYATFHQGNPVKKMKLTRQQWESIQAAAETPLAA